MKLNNNAIITILTHYELRPQSFLFAIVMGGSASEIMLCGIS